MAIDIHSTGRYFNSATQEYECWSVNQVSGEKERLGAMDALYAMRSPNAMKRWEQRVWRGFLRRFGAP